MNESTTHWVLQIKAGNRDAAQEIWERYYQRLVGLAKKRLSGRCAGRNADEDDIALSAFASFYRAAENGRFPQLSDSNDLWRLFIVIVQRKVAKQLRRASTRKRSAERTGVQMAGFDLDELASIEPTPEFCAIAVESFQRLLDRLREPSLQNTALLKMEGYTNDEIARRAKCSRSTVERKLRRIRHEWSSAAKADEELPS